MKLLLMTDNAQLMMDILRSEKLSLSLLLGSGELKSMASLLSDVILDIITQPNNYKRSNCLFFAVSWVTELLLRQLFWILTGTIP